MSHRLLVALALPFVVVQPAGSPSGLAASERERVVALELERKSEIRFELELGGQSIEGFELSSETRRAKRVTLAREAGEPVSLVRYLEASEIVRGPDGEHEEELELAGLSARIERGSSGFVARSGSGGGLSRELEELVLREELAPGGEAFALDWLLESLVALELERGAATEIEPELVLWLVGESGGLFDEAEGTMTHRGAQRRGGREMHVLAFEGRLSGTSEDEVEFTLELEGELWLEPASRKPARVALRGPLRASGAREGPASVALEGEGSFSLVLALDWD